MIKTIKSWFQPRDWHSTNNIRWFTIRETEDYRLEEKQYELVDMLTNEKRWQTIAHHGKGYHIPERRLIDKKLEQTPRYTAE